VIRDGEAEGEAGTAAAAAARTTSSSFPEARLGPGAGLVEPPAWPTGSRADAASRGLAEAYASVL
jgi:hypothetical protein